MWQSGVNCDGKGLKVCKIVNYELKDVIYELFRKVYMIGYLAQQLPMAKERERERIQ